MKKNTLLLIFIFLISVLQSQVRYVTNFGTSFSNPAEGGNPSNAILFDSKIILTAVSEGNGQFLHSFDGTNYQRLRYGSNTFDDFTSDNPNFKVRDIGGGQKQLFFTGNIRTGATTYSNNYLGSLVEGASQVETYAGANSGVLEVINDVVYFANSNVLRRLNVGTTTPVQVNSFASSIVTMIAFDGKLMMTTSDTNDAAGVELYEYDPVSDTTSLVSDINTSGDSTPSDFIVANNKLYFTADSGSGRELFVYDPQALIKVSKIDIVPSNIEDPQHLTYYQNGSNISIILSANAGASLGREPVRINTSNDSATLLSVRSGSDSSDPSGFTVYNGFVYFSANDGVNGVEVFRTDGTSVGTTRVSDINTGGDSVPNSFLEYRSELYFQATDGVTGYELYKITASNTVFSFGDDIVPGGSSFNPKPFVVYNDILYMSGRASTTVSSTHLFAYKAPTTFTGASNSLWDTAANWDNGLPDANTSAIIPSGETVSFIGGVQAECFDLTIDGGLIINKSSSVTVANNLQAVNNGITINSDYNPGGTNESGTLIVKGTASNNNITYNREIHALASPPNYNWSLISPPVIDANLNLILTSANNIAVSGSNRGIATYNSSFTGTTGWEYIQTSVNASNYDLVNGIGYSIASASTSTADVIVFRGPMQSTDVATPISNGSKNAWNLVGNPYPSFLTVNTAANASNNLLLENDAVLDSNFKALYFWDSTLNSGSGGYVAFNQSSGSKLVAPGQGFFVHSNTTGGNFTFTKAMQTTSSTEVFYKSENKSKTLIPELQIKITQDDKTKSTKIKYLSNTNLGLDEGYDAGLFNGEETSLSIFTQLADYTSSIPFMLQCVPQDYENIIVPVGLKTSIGQEISFTAQVTNLPTGLMIYLEDKLENTITRIDNNTYKITPSTALDGAGRFYIHTTQQALSIEDIEATNTINMHQIGNHIQVVGADTNTTVKIYNLLGQLAIEGELDNNAQIEISDKIKTGIYVVDLISDKRKFNKKIFLQN